MIPGQVKQQFLKIQASMFDMMINVQYLSLIQEITRYVNWEAFAFSLLRNFQEQILSN